MNTQELADLNERIIQEIKKRCRLVEVEASGRHVHLCPADV